jgi:hypothetical protein
MADTSTATEPGDALLRREEDGTITVIRADRFIRVSNKLLCGLDRDRVGEDGVLTLDTAGRYRYRLARPDPDTCVYERIEPTP